MRIWDISMTIHQEMQVYKNRDEKKPILTVMRSFENGKIHESRISMDLHTGTHLDAPLHTIEVGSSIMDMDLKRLITRCKVLDLTDLRGSIQGNDLQSFPIEAGDFILIKTQNSFEESFNTEFVYLAESGARYLSDRKISGVGIDGLGIERDQPGHPSHHHLLGSDIIVLEGLRLADVQQGEYTLIALPLKLANAEASPVRAVLLDFLL